MRLHQQAALLHAFRLPVIITLALLAWVFLLIPAFSQDSVVTVPYGDWLADILLFVGATIVTILGAILTWASRLLPAAIRGYVDAQMVKKVEQLLARAVTHGVNSAATTLKGRAAGIDVQQAVVADALRYAVEHGPDKLISWMGGAEAIRDKIIARLPFEVTGADQIVVTAPQPSPTPPAQDAQHS